MPALGCISGATTWSQSRTECISFCISGFALMRRTVRPLFRQALGVDANQCAGPLRPGTGVVVVLLCAELR